MSFHTHQNGSGGGRGDGGFTMLELLIVIAVLGILTAIAVVAMGNQSTRSVQGACAIDAQVVLTAQEARQTLTGSFAPDVASLVPEYLRSTPRNVDHYQITTDISGTVYVVPVAGGQAEPVTAEPSPCGSLT